jgi:hypothetical protein
LVSSTLSVKFARYQVDIPAIAQSKNSISLPAGNDSNRIPQRMPRRYSAVFTSDAARSRTL